MGVPKFYRWLSERYPCLSQVIKDHQIPEFDNLYLDMNGIIHPCSHPNDDDPHFRITEEQIFLNIFHYIEVLFRIIKPQKVFFMAVDGVAPRAKMNQQRSRRFRSAREAEDNIRKALKKGEVLPTEERFDSNCITPGTEFMVRLHEQLKYFINKKISTDPGWQGIKIYLSGHETPGEGEHKIMDFIRYERSQLGYDPNTRHCLYGLDADLIMLGLTSHDPHFSLLREEIRFGKNVKRISNPENITFHLLHLSLLREYIGWEFVSIKNKISFGYDVEKVIDDWILMGFLVGNDFIPNLPNFHINHDALPYLWQVYKDVIPGLDGYLHDGGYLNLARFETYLKQLAKFDLEKFEDAYIDLKWLEGKKGAENGDDDEDSFNIFERDEVDSAINNLDKNGSPKKPKKSSKLRDYLNEKGVLAEAMEEDDGDFSQEHEKYKLRYYYEKFKLNEDKSCKEIVEKLTLKYVEAIQWILHYYFNGISSWGWYFPYHYAPYVSDIKNFKDIPLTFDIGTPFLPFQQLLAVLPAASKKLLPEPFQNLMIMEQSSIIDYYPLEFETDLNGKKQDWEAVVLIPFIDEERLLAAMEPLADRLNKLEKTRNRHTPCLLYTFDKEKTEKYTSVSNAFPDIECCRASCEVVAIEKYRLAPKEILKGLLPNVKLDIYFPGFPTLKHIPHSGELKKCGVKVFQMHSRGESMVLSIDETDEPNVKEVADSMLGKQCYVGWPHLVEAFVTSVSDGKKKYLMAKDSPEKVHESTMTAKEISAWKKQASSEKQFFYERKAIEVGMVHVMVESCQIQGKRLICGAKGSVLVEKVWSETALPFPLQVTVKDLSVCDETDAGPVCSNITELFSVGTECFMMAIPHYGSSGKVIEVDGKQNRVRVQLTVIPEPDLMALTLNQDDFTETYMPAHIMAKRLGISTQVLSQITGKVFIVRGDKDISSRIDVGLNLKFSKQDKEVLGYARRFGGQWTYSTKTEQLVSKYQEKYPKVFDILSKSSSEVHKLSEVFPDSDESDKLSQLETWLKSLSSHKQQAVKCGSSTLDEPIIKQIEEAVEKLKAEKQNKKNVKVRVRPTVLYRPMKHMGQVAPDAAADFELFDRVVNVRTLGVAPYGLKGTIVGIHQGKTGSDEVGYEVLFDEPVVGGQSLRGSFENKLFVVQAWSLLNLTYGCRIELRKKGLLSPQQQHQREQQQRSNNRSGGWPAGYNPSGRGGRHRHHSPGGSWPSPTPYGENSPREHFSTPSNRSPNPRDHFSSPHGHFSTPRGRSSVPRDHLSTPRGHFSTPRGHFSSPRGRSSAPRDDYFTPDFINPKANSGQRRPPFSPHENSPRKQTPTQPKILKNSQNPNLRSNSPKQHTASSDPSAVSSAKESERIIRELLHLDGSPSSQTQLNSPPTKFNNPDHSFPVPPLSPMSPGSYNGPSGILTLVCSQNGYPPPTFSHHSLPQGGVISTVCAAGKLYQGSRSQTIVESTESAANMALMTSGLIPFLFPTQNVPQARPTRQSRSPAARFQSPTPHKAQQQQNRSQYSSSATPATNDGKREGSSKTKDEPRSDAPKGQPTPEQPSTRTKNPFIPHQVSLKQKEAAAELKTEDKQEKTETETKSKEPAPSNIPKDDENSTNPAEEPAEKRPTDTGSHHAKANETQTSGKPEIASHETSQKVNTPSTKDDKDEQLRTPDKSQQEPVKKTQKPNDATKPTKGNGKPTLLAPSFFSGPPSETK